ncbi:transporter substrate-binding domain-containing protein [Spirochaeta isovalerica]|uniref:Polar amino acid transport system substrate-binding protein n=1 Tax=Spirochaeta isovalerica TaxID=150 RepID=A0A841R9S6_9SPIO|nr:transporter substrate-binding domain-containing protein [Spirochaeta isovalerica]MBB6479679.1 polar amino acid transport system substrate-binding protein [Spirochaeta isovalerica]
MKRLFTLALLAVIVFSAYSGGKDDQQNDKLIVAMELQFPPFEMADADGTPRGISVDTAYALGEYLGREVVIENTAWTGLIPSIQSGKADIIISSMSITDEREKVVDFSIPYAASGLTLLINSDSPVKSYRDMNKSSVTVAVKSGTTGAIWAQENIPNATIQIFDEVAACALEVSQGKADAFIYDGLTTFELQKKFPGKTKVNLENLPGTLGGWGMAMKEGSPMKKDVDAFILEFRASGGFEELEKKYLGEIKAVFDEAGLPSFFDVQ